MALPAVAVKETFPLLSVFTDAVTIRLVGGVLSGEPVPFLQEKKVVPMAINTIDKYFIALCFDF